MSDAKKAALAQSKTDAVAQATAQQASAGNVQVSGTGPLGLPAAVSVLGMNVPTLAIVAIGGAILIALAALAVHAFRK